MNKSEKEVITNCVKRLNYLASLDHASFNANKEKDDQIKKAIRPYMLWFEIVAMKLEELQEISEEKDGYTKKYKMEECVRDSYFMEVFKDLIEKLCKEYEQDGYKYFYEADDDEIKDMWEANGYEGFYEDGTPCYS